MGVKARCCECHRRVSEEELTLSSGGRRVCHECHSAELSVGDPSCRGSVRAREQAQEVARLSAEVRESVRSVSQPTAGDTWAGTG